MIQPIHHTPINWSTPQEVLEKHNVGLDEVNPYLTKDPKTERTEHKFIENSLFSVDKSTFYATLRKTVVVALFALVLAGVIAAAVSSAQWVLPVIFAGGILYYAMVPTVLQPLKFKQYRASLVDANLTKMMKRSEEIHDLSTSELRKRFKAVGIHTRNYTLELADRAVKLKEHEVFSLFQHVLTRYEFWNDQIAEGKKKENELGVVVRSVRKKLKSDDRLKTTDEEQVEIALKLKEAIDNYSSLLQQINSETDQENRALLEDDAKDAGQLIKELEAKRKLSQKERAEAEGKLTSTRCFKTDLYEDDLIKEGINGIFLSAIRASYLSHIAKTPADKKALSDYGSVTPQKWYLRTLLQDLPSGKGYFQKASNGSYVTTTFLRKHLRDIPSIENMIFDQDAQDAAALSDTVSSIATDILSVDSQAV